MKEDEAIGTTPAYSYWRRRVNVGEGDCGLKTKELYCNAQ